MGAICRWWLVATRNSCGLVFDSRWNLFTHDNDHEGLPLDYVARPVTACHTGSGFRLASWVDAHQDP